MQVHIKRYNSSPHERAHRYLLRPARSPIARNDRHRSASHRPLLHQLPHPLDSLSPLHPPLHIRTTRHPTDERCRAGFVVRVGEVEEETGWVEGDVDLRWEELSRVGRVGGEEDFDGYGLCGWGGAGEGGKEGREDGRRERRGVRRGGEDE